MSIPFNDFKALLPQVWCAETSAAPKVWTPDNPALGQCAVTAALAEQIYGGEILWCAPKLPDGTKDSHYLNLINGTIYDFTRQQYKQAGVVFPQPERKAQGLGTTYNYVASFPQTLGRLSLLADRFNELGGNRQSQAWLLLDMDDTLIKTQQMYNYARQALAEAIFPGDAGKQQEVISYAADASTELYSAPHSQSARVGFSYAKNRFPTSLVMTMAHFRPKASEADILAAWTIGQQAFAPAALNDGAVELIAKAKRVGYKLGIITQGDDGVQRQRLSELPFMRDIDAVLVSPVKSASTFSIFMRAHGVNPATSFMLGDSLKSDMIPADAVGLQTVLLANATNWGAIEMEKQQQPARMRRTESLRDFAATL